jgi:2-dehydro-3-deoxygluconokinase
MTRVASIGECMIELKQAQGSQPGDLYSRWFGGDTLNTSVYLARLGVGVDYITALGDDPLSDEMIAGWREERVGTEKVARLKGKLPGIYLIATDAKGERRFFHWRDTAAARSLLDLPETEAMLQSLASYDVIYLSAVTLSIYHEAARARLLDALRQARARGARIAFDTNFRVRGWPDLEVARRIFRETFETSDIVLASTEDLLPLYPNESTDGLFGKIPSNEVVLRLAEPKSLVRVGDATHAIAAAPLGAPVVDTTAAGDSFSAAYIAARLAGAAPVDAARAGHRLAGVVVCHPGAIIPRSAMPAIADIVPASSKA